jgi:branched-chain amino acid aminotransferase
MFRTSHCYLPNVEDYSPIPIKPYCMNVVNSHIKTTPVPTSRIDEIDMNNIPFGRIFSDHMLVARYRDGQWQAPEIEPYGPLSFAPSMSVLNYGQAIFEGMKAHLNPVGEPLLFRPHDNLRRMNHSAQRMSMPELPPEIFIEGIKELIRLDRQWVPQPKQGSLYIRPLMFGTDEYIGVKASEEYIFTVFTCPVGPYYTQPVNLLASKDHVRASIGGTGAAKFAGNYAAAMLPDKLAKEKGYHNVLWLDGREHRYIEECGTMNIFFVIDGTVITPNLSGTILPGITRHSLITLLEEKGYRVEKRPLSIYEVQAAYREGRLDDAFGAGTAATVSPIAKIGFAGTDMVLPPMEHRPISRWLRDTLEQIKTGQIEDTHGWIVKVL